MRVTVNDAAVYTYFDEPIEIEAADELLIEWDPVSRVVGLGREALGMEKAGFGGTLAPDIRHTMIEVLDPDTGNPVSSSSHVFPPIKELLQVATSSLEMIIRVVQYDRAGRERELARFRTTAA